MRIMGTDSRFCCGSLILRKDPGNYRPVILTLAPGKVVVKIILGAVYRHSQNKAIVRDSQHGFMKGKSPMVKSPT